MSPLALLLALCMGVGFLVQACHLTGFNFADVSHTIRDRARGLAARRPFSETRNGR
jgi:hypothetical protein